jgi:deoxycytidylate deaminase
MLMGVAEAAALQSAVPNRHGCVIAKRGIIISTGFNKMKTHPAAAHTLSGHIHAELAAFIQARTDELRGTDLYSCRIMRHKGQPRGMAKPCKNCMELIHKAGIKRVYFTNKLGEMEMIKL